MPTGYTAKLYDGKPQSVNEFILSCSRAFGALMHQRDDSSDAEIRLRETDTSYRDDAIATARALLDEASIWNDDEANEKARAVNEALLAQYEKSVDTQLARLLRYQDMLIKVEAWNPPTVEHESLKEFMLSQLRESIDWDCGTIPIPPMMSGPQFRAHQMARAKRDIEYHTKELEKDIQRDASANKWITTLIDSLPSEADRG